jgi:hypothetical protein
MSMHAAESTTAALRTLIAAIPDDRLRELVLELMLNGLAASAPAAPAEAPALAKRRGGWPRGRRRGARKARATAARKVATRRRRYSRQPKANGSNGAETGSAKTLWQHAERLQPKAPWRAVVREFGINEAVAQDAHRNHTLPPGITPDAAARFLELPAG